MQWIGRCPHLQPFKELLPRAFQHTCDDELPSPALAMGLAPVKTYSVRHFENLAVTPSIHIHCLVQLPMLSKSAHDFCSDEMEGSLQDVGAGEPSNDGQELTSQGTGNGSPLRFTQHTVQVETFMMDSGQCR